MCPALSAVDPYLPLIGPILPPPNGETRPGRASVIAQYQEGRGAGYGGIRRRWGLLTSVLKHVTFPYRKEYIFDNKLEFSGIKLAESYGFRYSNFKVNSQVIQVSLWCFKFKPFGYFRLQWYWLYPHDGTGSPSWRRKQPMCLFKG